MEMTSWSAYVLFGVPVVGILLGYGALLFLRFAGQWAAQERAQRRTSAPDTVYHEHLPPAELAAAPFLAADAVKRVVLMRKATLDKIRRSEGDAASHSDAPLAHG